MDSEIYTEITPQEYEERVAKLQRVMFEQELDAVILTEETNIRWLSGYWVLIMQDGWSPTAAVIPCSDRKQPLLLMGAEATGESLSMMRNVRYWEEGLNPDLTAQKVKSWWTG